MRAGSFPPIVPPNAVPVPLPKALVHRGVVAASAFLIDASLVGCARGSPPRAGALDAGRRGLPGPPRLAGPPARAACGCAATARPACRWSRSGSRWAAPWSARRSIRRSCAPSIRPDGAVVRPRAGRTTIERPAEADREDPAGWLDVAHFEVDRHRLARRAAGRAAAAGPRARRLRRPHPPQGGAAAAPELAEVLAALSRREPHGRITAARWRRCARRSACWRTASSTLRWSPARLAPSDARRRRRGRPDRRGHLGLRHRRGNERRGGAAPPAGAPAGAVACASAAASSACPPGSPSPLRLVGCSAAATPPTSSA